MAVLTVEEGLDTLASRARFAVLALYLFMAACIPLLAIDVAQLAGTIQLEALPSESWVTAVQAVSAAYTLLFFVSVVLVSMWIHRAHQNLFDAGYDGLEFTAGWSVGWFFVPFACLLMPLRAMREAWYISVGESDDGSIPTNLLIWWILWLAGNFISYGSQIPVFGLISTGCVIGSAWMLKTIIEKISAAQQQTLQIGQTFA